MGLVILIAKTAGRLSISYWSLKSRRLRSAYHVAFGRVLGLMAHNTHNEISRMKSGILTSNEMLGYLISCGESFLI
ncbi:hypothetical protein [Agathobacter sp.]|uniref:hypothetical protein n=1 Tax=Agathobacter sp. TaxID=2021311 RepID=UPI003AB80151